VAADGLPGGAGDLAGAVGVGGQDPAHLVEHHVMVPPVVLEVGEAGPASAGAVDDVVGFASRRGLVTAAGELAGLVPQRDQPPQVDRDVVGLARWTFRTGRCDTCCGLQRVKVRGLPRCHFKIAGTSGQIATKTARDHDAASPGDRPRLSACVISDSGD
jgi:hypothetical protein